jgi:Fic family protein
MALSRADQALGKLDGLGLLLPNPHLLARPYLRREAVASTRIEGTQSSLGEVLAAEEQHETAVRSADVQEVLNYIRALEHGIQRLHSLPLSNRLLREMHADLLVGVRGEERTPGEFRRSQNWIGGTGPSDAVFVPPPPERLPETLTDFERFVHEPVDIPLLVRCALLHYQFETIHPFLDGNGRLGRLLVAFHLIQQGALAEPLLYVSPYLERHRDRYVEHLQAVREQGDYESWVAFFLDAVAAQAESAVSTAQALTELVGEFRNRLKRIRARGQAVAVAERLIGFPYVSAPRLAMELGITRTGAQYVIASLERAGIVARAPSQSRTALYVAPDVLRLLEA